jgi:hypothetical protein
METHIINTGIFREIYSHSIYVLGLLHIHAIPAMLVGGLTLHHEFPEPVLISALVRGSPAIDLYPLTILFNSGRLYGSVGGAHQCLF